MKDFAGKTAVITGGGTGMGRELARQLVAEGCDVAMCDVSAKAMAETVRLIEADGKPQGAKVTTHIADVSLEAALIDFREELKAQHDTDRIHLLFNNAGIGGGGSMVTDSRAAWEKTFNVCWGGVYLGVRTFLPMLMAAEEGHIVNTSSVNGFWATIGPNTSHTAYAAAKFAVKGFTEALITDLRLTAPHIKCSVVMPGHIGTSIVANSRKVQAGADADEMSADEMSADELAAARERMTKAGMDMSQTPDAAIQAMVAEAARRFLEDAPMTAAQAAKVILDGVKAERWRILVGEDAHRLDEWVRREPENAYEPEFFNRFAAEVGWRLGG
jgi:NAD(P)-dependent dehydrogenase (short-subunit alcohol dehydrogenase family)